MLSFPHQVVEVYSVILNHELVRDLFDFVPQLPTVPLNGLFSAFAAPAQLNPSHTAQILFPTISICLLQLLTSDELVFHLVW